MLVAVERPASPGRLAIAPGCEIRVVSGDPMGAALAEALRQRDLPARAVSPDQAAAPGAGGIVLVAGGEDPGAFLRQAFRVTRQLAPRLREAGRSGGALLATVTRLDGAFGLAGGEFEPLWGGLAGLPKTVAREWPEVHCRALDVAPGWDAAEAVAEELASAGPLEVGLAPGRRRVLKLAASSPEPPPSTLQQGDLVLVTGGGRGITAEAALALARAFRPALVLLGRSPKPVEEPEWLAGLHDEAEIKRAILQHERNGSPLTPVEVERSYRRYAANREIRRNLHRLAGVGAVAEYHSVDVRHRQALQALVARVRSRYGPVRRILHGAGVLADRRLEEKTDE